MQLSLTIVSEGRSISGNNLPEEINTAFVHVTQHLEPIHSVLLDVHNEDVFPDIPSEFIISEIDVYCKLSAISTLKSADLILYLTGLKV